MIRKYNNRSFAYGVPGIVIINAGGVCLECGGTGFVSIAGWGLVLAGSILLTIGIGYYVASRGRSLGWLILGILPMVALPPFGGWYGGWISTIIFGCLRDRASQDKTGSGSEQQGTSERE